MIRQSNDHWTTFKYIAIKDFFNPDQLEDALRVTMACWSGERRESEDESFD